MIDAGEFDYVIAGGGMVAARLSENPGGSVCIEPEEKDNSFVRGAPAKVLEAQTALA